MGPSCENRDLTTAAFKSTQEESKDIMTHINLTGNKEVFIFKEQNEIWDFIINEWINISKEAIESRGKFCVALSVRNTPFILYRKLADACSILPWDKIHIFLVDERFVHFDHLESNYRFMRENFLRYIDIPQENIHSIDIKYYPKFCVKEYEAELVKFFNLKRGELPEFDLMMLGIGEDGHIASLFPGLSVLRERKSLVVAVDYKKADNQRISLSLSVINNAVKVIFILTGRNKASIVRRVIQEKDSSLPASMVETTKGKIYFLLDDRAACLLGGRKDD